MLPYDDCYYGHPSDTPKHIATWLSQWGYTLRDNEYFGGVVIFTAEQFEKSTDTILTMLVGVWKMTTYIGDV